MYYPDGYTQNYPGQEGPCTSFRDFAIVLRILGVVFITRKYACAAEIKKGPGVEPGFSYLQILVKFLAGIVVDYQRQIANYRHFFQGGQAQQAGGKAFAAGRAADIGWRSGGPGGLPDKRH